MEPEERLSPVRAMADGTKSRVASRSTIALSPIHPRSKSDSGRKHFKNTPAQRWSPGSCVAQREHFDFSRRIRDDSRSIGIREIVAAEHSRLSGSANGRLVPPCRRGRLVVLRPQPRAYSQPKDRIRIPGIPTAPENLRG